MITINDTLKAYKNVEARGCMKHGVMYIGNLNDEDNLYYWSPINDLDSLSFVSVDKYGKEVCVC